ncbi:hypothetical protein D7X74_03330 [Corallococcus sp. CA047B]|uniref:hypothetical protein n=1 Tax=Corallococcus sp. CA047B TaxID=2316729 RepID=UPI000EA3ED70|nr:hypothetical protein [Corallococcus sp. CA047B]RKH20627.1 hypothetical protein D7X74_03330 [Corallococcus sp. CA047B]
MYKFVKRDEALDETMGGDSLYALTQANNEVYAKIMAIYRAYVNEKDKHTIAEAGVSYFSMLELFNNLLGDSDAALNDDRIAAELFKRNAEKARAITGKTNAPAFITHLDSTIEATAASFRETLAALRNSFKLTYRHTDIVSLLKTTKVVTKPGLVKSRVFETAYILDRILDKKRFLATSLLLGIMHVERFQTHKDTDTKRPYYNQGSALFTLLTFSYTPALSVEQNKAWSEKVLSIFEETPQDDTFSKEELIGQLRRLHMGLKWATELATEVEKKGAAGVQAQIANWKKKIAGHEKSLQALKSDRVQYGWKMFGSCLGIYNELLPTTYVEAAEMWGQFNAPGYKRVVSDDSPSPMGREGMLDTFDKALGAESFWEKTDFASFGLTLSASALTEMSYVGPVARILGWYTSSNHAGLSCSDCKTVHGSRVSLVRLWHRCSKCQKVYCAHCASGLALYAVMALGVVGTVGGWWMGMGTALYSATVGWATGSTATHTTSRFMARKCKSCGTQTAALY